MDIRELFMNMIDYIDNNRAKIMNIFLIILATILLMVTLFFSKDEFSVSDESSYLISLINDRNYSSATNYYNDIQSNFSESKMKRFNKSISKKINKFLLDNGDRYIKEEITKEHYIGLVNMINNLSDVEIDVESIVSQSSRVCEMYKDDDISYDIAISYMKTLDTLSGINNELDEFKQEIEIFYKSRELYNEAILLKDNKVYYEAIELFDKIIIDDDKYYKLAQEQKEECIDLMYDYYIEESVVLNENGNYQEALSYIEYLKTYYYEDEKIIELENKYQNNLALYDMTNEDIINLIALKGGKDKESLSINTFKQMVGNEKYYYVEVFEYDTLVDEVLINPKDKKIYSYKGKGINYNTNYNDGYFRVVEGGNIQFAIQPEESKFILENKLSANGDGYKNISIEQKDDALRYSNYKDEINSFVKEEEIYDYAVVSKGFFRKKEVYLVNIYDKSIYKVDEGKIVKY